MPAHKIYLIYSLFSGIRSHCWVKGFITGEHIVRSTVCVKDGSDLYDVGSVDCLTLIRLNGLYLHPWHTIDACTKILWLWCLEVIMLATSQRPATGYQFLSGKQDLSSSRELYIILLFVSWKYWYYYEWDCHTDYY